MNARRASQDTDQNDLDPIRVPFVERLDGGCGCAACCDDWVEEDGEVGCVVVGVVWWWCWGRTMVMMIVREVVVVFYRLERDGIAEEAKVVHCHG